MEYIILIKKYRIMKGMTQTELARKSKVRQSYISQLENNPNTKSPTVKIISRIADALEVCPHALVKYDINCNENCLNNCKQNFL